MAEKYAQKNSPTHSRHILDKTKKYMSQSSSKFEANKHLPSWPTTAPCHFQSPGQGPPNVETSPVVGTIFRTLGAWHGMPKIVPFLQIAPLHIHMKTDGEKSPAAQNEKKNSHRNHLYLPW